MNRWPKFICCRAATGFGCAVGLHAIDICRRFHFGWPREAESYPRPSIQSARSKAPMPIQAMVAFCCAWLKFETKCRARPSAFCPEVRSGLAAWRLLRLAAWSTLEQGSTMAWRGPSLCLRAIHTCGSSTLFSMTHQSSPCCSPPEGRCGCFQSVGARGGTGEILSGQ